MPGLEVDNLLAQLASWGLLRALDEARPVWLPRLSWAGPPWCARLHLADEADEAEVAQVANEGVLSIARRFDVGSHRNVSFDEDAYLEHLQHVRGDEQGSGLAAALTAQRPHRRDGTLMPSPFVLMFGQGHQHFLERLVDVPLGVLPKRLQRRKPAPNLNDPARIADALFAPWRRDDETDAFRWDPKEDQRYALRFDDPSEAGAAATVHGANRLATLAFASLTCAPRRDAPGVAAVRRARATIEFIWPIWDVPLGLGGILSLLSHPDVIAGRLQNVRAFGVREIYRARRISNGKFMNVSWAQPFAGDPLGGQRRSSR
ncbi:MAG: hypothetical protein OZ948_05670 [Deltaproteobacteria bacterium]|nr:hypothetical protein [Deltaproteobacteria bacterium]